MNFIKLNNYQPIFEALPIYDADEFPPFPQEDDNDFDRLVRNTALGLKEEEENEPKDSIEFVSEEVVERDVSEIDTSLFLLNLCEENILYIRESKDLANPGSIIVFITGGALYFTETIEEIILSIAEATGASRLNGLL